MVETLDLQRIPVPISRRSRTVVALADGQRFLPGNRVVGFQTPDRNSVRSPLPQLELDLFSYINSSVQFDDRAGMANRMAPPYKGIHPLFADLLGCGLCDARRCALDPRG